MGATTTTKPVNLYQLGQEVGGSPSFRAVGDLTSDDEKRIESEDVTDQALADAVANHTADWSITPPVPAEEQERLDAAATLEQLWVKGWANLTSAEKADLARLFFLVAR